jgi:hypothetical protein
MWHCYSCSVSNKKKLLNYMKVTINLALLMKRNFCDRNSPRISIKRVNISECATWFNAVYTSFPSQYSVSLVFVLVQNRGSTRLMKNILLSCNVTVRNFCRSLHSNITLLKSRAVGCTWHVACKGESKSIRNQLIREPEVKRLCGVKRRGRKNIKTHLWQTDI